MATEDDYTDERLEEYDRAAIAQDDVLVMGFVTVVRNLRSALLESARHALGKCDCAMKYPGHYTEVTCGHLMTKALDPFVEVGEPPGYELRLRSARKEPSVVADDAPTPEPLRPRTGERER